ncbi:MAG: hypothetical protein K2N91_03605, partial [Muribaculaceae bacterium]|nr:hypothetical protein [Muribaculaceae bacterium]
MSANSLMEITEGLIADLDAELTPGSIAPARLAGIYRRIIEVISAVKANADTADITLDNKIDTKCESLDSLINSRFMQATNLAAEAKTVADEAQADYAGICNSKNKPYGFAALDENARLVQEIIPDAPTLFVTIAPNYSGPAPEHLR